MKDKCVVCKKDSHHNKDEHIKVRIGYIEGNLLKMYWKDRWTIVFGLLRRYLYED